MKLYRVAGIYVGSQAEAKAKARQTRSAFAKLDVPTDKHGLIGYLNALGGAGSIAVAAAGRKPEPIMSRDQQLDEGYQLDGDKPNTGHVAIAAGADAIADWILDHATQAQVERLFSCLGARFGEARRG